MSRGAKLEHWCEAPGCKKWGCLGYGDRWFCSETHAASVLRVAAHTCHAIGCAGEVPPALLMCARHWRMVPRELQARVYREYRDGQCDDKRPSRAWLEAANQAIAGVAEREGKTRQQRDLFAAAFMGGGRV